MTPILLYRHSCSILPVITFLANNTDSIATRIKYGTPTHIHDNIHTVGSSSNASSSDDEIKEAFEGLRQSSYLPPQPPSYLWTLPKDDKAGQAFMYPFVTNKPIKVAPVGHKKPKFFAQMSGSRTERPHLDFNKMQHSKRLIMVSFVWLGVVCPK